MENQHGPAGVLPVVHVFVAVNCCRSPATTYIPYTGDPRREQIVEGALGGTEFCQVLLCCILFGNLYPACKGYKIPDRLVRLCGVVGNTPMRLADFNTMTYRSHHVGESRRCLPIRRFSVNGGMPLLPQGRMRIVGEGKEPPLVDRLLCQRLHRVRSQHLDKDINGQIGLEIRAPGGQVQVPGPLRGGHTVGRADPRHDDGGVVGCVIQAAVVSDGDDARMHIAGAEIILHVDLFQAMIVRGDRVAHGPDAAVFLSVVALDAQIEGNDLAVPRLRRGDVAAVGQIGVGHGRIDHVPVGHHDLIGRHGIGSRRGVPGGLLDGRSAELNDVVIQLDRHPLREET